MKYVNDEYIYTYEEKKSKFIAYIFSYKIFKEKMQELKNKHTKARHFVYAYRYLNEFNQIVENSSDDGEPRGTSGRPTLSVVSGNELINTAIIIVRYFGGIKLGTGGLVRAYSQAANLVIKEAKLLVYTNLEIKSLSITYTELSKLEYLCKTLDINIVNKEFLQDVILSLEASSKNFLSLERCLKEELKREFSLS